MPSTNRNFKNFTGFNKTPLSLTKSVKSQKNTVSSELISQNISEMLSSLSVNGNFEFVGSPLPTLTKALGRLNLDPLEFQESVDFENVEIANLNTRSIVNLENRCVCPVEVTNSHYVFQGKNIASIDGSSVVLPAISFATIYARAGSFGFSQRRDKNSRLSFSQGINRLWTDVAINVEARNGIIVNEDRSMMLDKILDDPFTYPYKDAATVAEVEALALTEAAATILLVEQFGGDIDLCFLDGPLIMPYGGQKYSLQRLAILKKASIPCISIVKNPVASPVLKAAGMKDSTDAAYFERLPPGSRSAFFLHQSNSQRRSNQFKREPYVFFYYKTPTGQFLFRIEAPCWVLDEYKPETIAGWVAADSAMSGGNNSHLITQVDAFVRLRGNMRALVRELFSRHLYARFGHLSENYNSVRWPWQ